MKLREAYLARRDLQAPTMKLPNVVFSTLTVSAHNPIFVCRPPLPRQEFNRLRVRHAFSGVDIGETSPLICASCGTCTHLTIPERSHTEVFVCPACPDGWHFITWWRRDPIQEKHDEQVARLQALIAKSEAMLAALA